MTTSVAILATAAFLLAGLARTQESLDAEANAWIRDEGLNRSQVAQTFDTFVNVIGPRLTGSDRRRTSARPSTRATRSSAGAWRTPAWNRLNSAAAGSSTS